MDQSTTTTAVGPTVFDVAKSVLADPTSAKPADLSRLAAFVLDHPEHVSFYRRVVGGAPRPNGPLGRRLDGIGQQTEAPALAAPETPVADPALNPTVSVTDETEHQAA